MSTVRALVVLLVSVALLWVAMRVRTPLLRAFRSIAAIAVILVAMLIVIDGRRATGFCSPLRRATRAMGMAASLLAIGVAGERELVFQHARAIVMSADPGRLARVGAHVIVGFEHFEEVCNLVERRAVAGIFVTARNVQNRTIGDVREDIDRLQAMRRAQGLLPLWVAADQEGGNVSRLSPPLSLPPSLSEMVHDVSRFKQHPRSPMPQVERSARELSRIGVNLNFAPVVDIDHGIRAFDDIHTKISDRAIDSDPAVVAAVAETYCTALARQRVRCTLKHFPGLGRVRGDTHIDVARLSTPPSLLRASDWIPFRQNMGWHGNVGSAQVTMLGHVILTAIDPDSPVSYSRRVINDLLRGDWGYTGLLVTDDLCMGAVYDRAEGVGGAAVRALNAGADLILVSYDPDQYYFIVQALLRADANGQLDRSQLQRSDSRLRAIQPYH